MYTLLVALIFTSSCAFGAEQIPTSSDLPQKDQIQKQLLQSEPFQTQQLIPQLAPLIAEYADNTVKGYLTLSEKYSNAFPAGCDNSHYEEWQKFHQNKFGKKLFYYPGAVVDNTLRSRIDWIITPIYCGFTPEDVTHSDLRETGYSNQDPIFPKSILKKLIDDKKEGAEINFVFQEIHFILICNQQALNPDNPKNFEDILKNTPEYMP